MNEKLRITIFDCPISDKRKHDGAKARKGLRAAYSPLLRRGVGGEVICDNLCNSWIKRDERAKSPLYGVGGEILNIKY